MAAARFFCAFILFCSCLIARSQLITQCTDCNCKNPVVNCKNVCEVCSCYNNTIDCSSMKLNASFPSSPSFWPANENFTNLILDDNLIGRVVQFPSLHLTSISIRDNQIEALDAKAFFNLPNLEDLDLSYNQLTYYNLHPEIFEGPFSGENFEPIWIRSLNLSYNELNDLNQNLFEHLPHLNRLLLNGNPLADNNGNLGRNTVVAIASIANLQLLDLSQTGMSDLPHTFLKNLPELRELVLMENQFKQLPADALSFTSSLRILNFNSNPITVISTERKFPSIPTLRQLHISHMPTLKRIEESSLKGLVGLVYLECSNNPALEYISEGALSAVNMTKLELQDNRLHYLPAKLIDRWDKLVSLDIRGNEWSCDCENQWLITTLIPLEKTENDGLICSNPEQMRGKSMSVLAERNYHMRCLDYYGNHPERDGSFLVATFCIIIIALLIIGGILLYRRGRCRKGKEIDYTAIYQQQVREDHDYRF